MMVRLVVLRHRLIPLVLRNSWLYPIQRFNDMLGFVPGRWVATLPVDTC
ncbi:MAG: hypothetical protein WCB18_05285 [Thermoplasmata archaeon]